MENQQKHLADLEHDASQLVEQLAALKREVQSYQNASTQLDRAATNLAGFLHRTELLTDKTHTLIGAVNRIVDSSIYQDLAAVRSSMDALASEYASLKTSITVVVRQDLAAVKSSVEAHASQTLALRKTINLGFACSIILQVAILLYLAFSK